MGWLAAAILGAIAGWIAALAAKRDRGRPLAWLIVIGATGAIGGDALSRPLLAAAVGEGEGGFPYWGLVAAIAGALVLLGVALIASPRGRA